MLQIRVFNKQYAGLYEITRRGDFNFLEDNVVLENVF